MASIRQRPDGRWRARYRDDEGREHARHFDRKRDGEAWLVAEQANLTAGTWIDPGRAATTLADFYARWVQHQLWSDNTRRIADRAMRRCVFAGAPLVKLRRSDGEAWVKALTAELAPTTVKTTVSYVRIVLRAAIADRLLTHSPLEGVKLPAIRRTEHSMRIPTPDEVRRIRAAIEPAFACTVDVMAYAGLRIGEVAGLQVGDVLFPRRTLYVQRQVQSIDGGLAVTEPKHGSERKVPVPDELLLRLSRHVETVGVHTDDGWLFGRPPSTKALRYQFVKACRAAGVTGITPHDLRHHYASGLISAGLDPVAVARAMGHSSASITLAVYAHLWPDAADRTRAAAAGLMASLADSADQLRTVGGLRP